MDATHLPTLLTEPPTRADVYVPDGSAMDEAVERTSIVGIGAHPDDLELGMVAVSLGHTSPCFAGVTCTDGAGSVRGESTVELSSAEFVAVRAHEQRIAAELGGYSLQVQLGHPSSVVTTDAQRAALVGDLVALLGALRPVLVVTHNLADRHGTHLGVTLAVIEACRQLPVEHRPERVLGVELWRGLDWLAEVDKVRLPFPRDVDGRWAGLAQRMAVAHVSQVEAKSYDHGALGRRWSNATFDATHEADEAQEVTLAMDLTPLVRDADLDPGHYLAELLERFACEAGASLDGVVG